MPGTMKNTNGTFEHTRGWMKALWWVVLCPFAKPVLNSMASLSIGCLSDCWSTGRRSGSSMETSPGTCRPPWSLCRTVWMILSATWMSRFGLPGRYRLRR